MNLTKFERAMFSTLQIYTLDEKYHIVGSGSGFLFDFGESNIALVTNRHVAEQGAYVKLLFTKSTKSYDPDVGNVITAILPTSDYRPHPDPEIDLAVLPLNSLLSTLTQSDNPVFITSLNLKSIPTLEVWSTFDVMESVFSIGYPRGTRDTVNNLPIFRRGVTATHPKYDFEGRPEVLIDMHCHEGSSGSPVFLYNPREHDLVLLGIHQSAYYFQQPVSSGREASINLPFYFDMTYGIGNAIKSTKLLEFMDIHDKRS